MSFASKVVQLSFASKVVQLSCYPFDPHVRRKMKRKRKLSLKTASDVVKAHDCEAIAYELVTKVYLNRSSARKPAAISLATLPLSSIANELYLNSAQGRLGVYRSKTAFIMRAVSSPLRYM